MCAQVISLTAGDNNECLPSSHCHRNICENYRANKNGETENYASFTYFPPLCIMYHVGRKSSDSEAGI